MREMVECAMVLATLVVYGQSSFAQSPPPGQVTLMDRLSDYVIEEGNPNIVAEGPSNSQVSRFDDPFALRIDLAPRHIKSHDFDLIKLQVKTDPHAFLVVSLENFPQQGELSHWYVLDGARSEQPWRTITIDLRRPEEIKKTGTYKGMGAEDPSARGLRIRGRINELHQVSQPPGRTLWMGKIRFVKKAIDLDWDETKFSIDAKPGKDLVYRYPLAVSNRSEKEVVARVELSRIDGSECSAKLTKSQISLKPGETQSVEAVLTWPAAGVAKARPLSSERFEAIASVREIPDSDVTILRSSDPIPLVVTVPFPEDQLKFPLLPRVKEMPVSITGFDSHNQAEAVKLANEVSPKDLELAIGDGIESRGFSYGPSKQNWELAGRRYRDGLTACAFLYDTTGKKEYLDKGTSLLLKAAEIFPTRLKRWREAPYARISDGIFAENTLSLGWTLGSMRWPYHYKMHGAFNDFDLLARDMDSKSREKILRDFILPAAVLMRDHHFGLSNQQDVVNYPVLYAGLATRNWPLAAFAYDSPHGVLGQIRHDFDDEGLAGEGNYHKPALEPILNACELLRARGIDLYNQRLYMMLHSRTAAALKKSYDSPMLAFADSQRFVGKEIVPPPKSDGLHLATGVTQLRWKSLEVAMNWGQQQNRGAPDRCSLRINDLGGGMYTHSSVGQSIVIVDEELQTPAAAEVLGYDVDGPVQYITASSDKHYPGSSIVRTFALIDEQVLIVDRIRSKKSRTVDWCLKWAGDKISLDRKNQSGGFTDKPDDKAKSATFGANPKDNTHYFADTDEAWNEGNGRLHFAAEPKTRVIGFHLKWNRDDVPILLVRRREVEQTDFVACFSKKVKSVEKKVVLDEAGKEADAVGVVITTSNGREIRAIVNYRPGTTVHIDGLSTQERFATDFEK